MWANQCVKADCVVPFKYSYVLFFQRVNLFYDMIHGGPNLVWNEGCSHQSISREPDSLLGAWL